MEESPEHIRVVDCATADEFLNALTVHAEPFCLDRTADWFFRGHADHSQLLIPTALRPDVLEDLRKLAGRETFADFHVDCGAFQVWLEAFLLKGFLNCADECLTWGDALHLHVLFADGEVWALSFDAPMSALQPFLTITGAKSHGRDQLLSGHKIP